MPNFFVSKSKYFLVERHEKDNLLHITVFETKGNGVEQTQQLTVDDEEARELVACIQAYLAR